MFMMFAVIALCIMPLTARAATNDSYVAGFNFQSDLAVAQNFNPLLLDADLKQLADAQRKRYQLEVCLHYMIARGNQTLSELMSLAITVNDKSSSYRPLDSEQVELMTGHMQRLSFAEVAEMCVHVAKKSIGAKKTAELLEAIE